MTGRGHSHARLILAVVATGLTGLVLTAWTFSILAEDRFETGLSTIQMSLTGTGKLVTGELTRGVVISQSFVATRDGLSRIDVQLGTYSRQNSVPVDFILSRAPGGAPLRTVEVLPEDIVDSAYHQVWFDPISDSAGQRYFASIESPAGRPGDAFTLWIVDCDCYPQGDAFINGAHQPNQDLAMRVIYSIETSGVAEDLVNRVSQYKPEALKGMGLVLTALVAAALAVLAVGVSTQVALAEEGRQKFPWVWVAASALLCVALVPIVW